MFTKSHSLFLLFVKRNAIQIQTTQCNLKQTIQINFKQNTQMWPNEPPNRLPAWVANNPVGLGEPANLKQNTQINLKQSSSKTVLYWILH